MNECLMNILDKPVAFKSQWNINKIIINACVLINSNDLV